jgi:hypothetical protein
MAIIKQKNSGVEKVKIISPKIGSLDFGRLDVVERKKGNNHFCQM